MTPTIGEIRLVGFTFAPVGWAQCNGQLLSISENDALYTLIGTTYGGDGQTTFGLPDMRGRVVVGTGQGGGQSRYQAGQTGGVENVTLTTSQLPAHTHALGANVTANATTQANGTNPAPAGAYPGTSTAELYGPATGSDAFGAGAVSGTATPAGGSQPHSNLQPLLVINYIIALEGIFPSQP